VSDIECVAQQRNPKTYLSDGSRRPTGKGVALAARHLPALKGLIDAALAEGEANLLNERGVA
jgi:hypothetical protein